MSKFLSCASMNRQTSLARHCSASEVTEQATVDFRLVGGLVLINVADDPFTVVVRKRARGCDVHV